MRNESDIVMTHKVSLQRVTVERGLGGVGNTGVNVDTTGTDESVVLVVHRHCIQLSLSR
jgi:hypothetical protein